MAKKKPIVSKEGQWKYPGQETIIPNANGRITMQGVPYPVFGIDDLGYSQMMMPGAEYQFPGNSVYEIPMAKNGGTKRVKIHSLPKAQNGEEVTWTAGTSEPWEPLPEMTPEEANQWAKLRDDAVGITGNFANNAQIYASYKKAKELGLGYDQYVQKGRESAQSKRESIVPKTIPGFDELTLEDLNVLSKLPGSPFMYNQGTGEYYVAGPTDSYSGSRPYNTTSLMLDMHMHDLNRGNHYNLKRDSEGNFIYPGHRSVYEGLNKEINNIKNPGVNYGDLDKDAFDNFIYQVQFSTPSIPLPSNITDKTDPSDEALFKRKMDFKKFSESLGNISTDDYLNSIFQKQNNPNTQQQILENYIRESRRTNTRANYGSPFSARILNEMLPEYVYGDSPEEQYDILNAKARDKYIQGELNQPLAKAFGTTTENLHPNVTRRANAYASDRVAEKAIDDVRDIIGIIGPTDSPGHSPENVVNTEEFRSLMNMDPKLLEAIVVSPWKGGDITLSNNDNASGTKITITNDEARKLLAAMNSIKASPYWGYLAEPTPVDAMIQGTANTLSWMAGNDNAEGPGTIGEKAHALTGNLAHNKNLDLLSTLGGITDFGGNLLKSGLNFSQATDVPSYESGPLLYSYTDPTTAKVFSEAADMMMDPVGLIGGSGLIKKGLNILGDTSRTLRAPRYLHSNLIDANSFGHNFSRAVENNLLKSGLGTDDIAKFTDTDLLNIASKKKPELFTPFPAKAYVRNPKNGKSVVRLNYRDIYGPSLSAKEPKYWNTLLGRTDIETGTKLTEDMLKTHYKNVFDAKAPKPSPVKFEGLQFDRMKTNLGGKGSLNSVVKPKKWTKAELDDHIDYILGSDSKKDNVLIDIFNSAQPREIADKLPGAVINSLIGLGGLTGLALEADDYVNPVIQKYAPALYHKLGLGSDNLLKKHVSISLNDEGNTLSTARVNDNSADGNVILGGEFIFQNPNTVNTPEWFKNNPTVQLGDPSSDYGSVTAESAPGFWGVENGKIKAGPLNEFAPDTKIVPMRPHSNAWKPIGKAGSVDGHLRFVDRDNNIIYNNAGTGGKILLYSPTTKAAHFVYNTGDSEEAANTINNLIAADPDLRSILLDNGRYSHYIDKGDEKLEENDFKEYTSGDVGNPGNPGFNLVLKRKTSKKLGGAINFRNGGQLPKAQFGPPTYADSAMVANKANEVGNWLVNHGYKQVNSNPANFSNPAAFKQDLESGIRRFTNANHNDNIIDFRTGTRGHFPGGNYTMGYTGHNPVWLQRDMASGVLNPDAPASYYDTRILPQRFDIYDATNQFGNYDSAGKYTYEKLAVTPWKKLTTKQKIQRLERYGTSGSPYKDPKKGIKELKAQLQSSAAERTAEKEMTKLEPKDMTPIKNENTGIPIEPQLNKKSNKQQGASGHIYRTPIHTANNGVVYRVHDAQQKFIAWEDEAGNVIPVENATGSPTSDFDPVYKPKIVKAPKFNYGGQLPKAQKGKNILYVDSKKDPAYKAYNDSLSLYNAYPENFSLPTSPHLNYIPSRSIQNQIAYDNQNSSNSAYATNLNFVNSNKIKPTSINWEDQLYISMHGAGFNQHHAYKYKKPTRKVIVRQEIPKPVMKDITKLPIPQLDIKPQLQNLPALYTSGPKLLRSTIYTPDGPKVRVADMNQKFIRWETPDGESMDFETAPSGDWQVDFPATYQEAINKKAYGGDASVPKFNYGGFLPKAQVGTTANNINNMFGWGNPEVPINMDYLFNNPMGYVKSTLVDPYTPYTVPNEYYEILKRQESAAKDGYRDGKYYPYKSPEGGNYTIGYGHKLTDKDVTSGRFKNGITDKEVDNLFHGDVDEHLERAKQRYDAAHGKGAFSKLHPELKTLALDFTYNGIDLSSKDTGYPKFWGAANQYSTAQDEALKKQAYQTMLNNYVRNMTDPQTKKLVPLGERNKYTLDVLNNLKKTGGELVKAQNGFNATFDPSKSVNENMELNRRAQAMGWNSVADYEKSGWGQNELALKQRALINNPEAQKFARPVENKDQLYADNASSAQKTLNQVYYGLSNPLDALGQYSKYGYVPQGNVGNYGFKDDSAGPISLANATFNPFAWGNAAYRFANEVSNPDSWTTGRGAVNMTTDFLEALPFFSEVSKTAQPALRFAANTELNLVDNLVNTATNAYDKVATGNSFIPRAWKVERPNFPIKSTDYIARPNTDAEIALLDKYGRGMSRLTPEEWAQMENLTRSGATDFSKGKYPISRIIGYYNRGSAENKLIEGLKVGDVFHTPAEKTIRTWSAGTPGKGDLTNFGTTRLVIPSKYTKGLGSNFSAMPYNDKRLSFIWNPETGRINSMAVAEKELMGNLPKGFKVIGTSNENGLRNLIIKPLKKLGGSLPKAQNGIPSWQDFLSREMKVAPAQNLVGDVRKVRVEPMVAESTRPANMPKAPAEWKGKSGKKIIEDAKAQAKAQEAYDALPEELKRRDVLTADTRSDAEKFARRAWTAISQPMETIAAINKGYDIPSGYLGMHDAYEGYGVGSPMTSVVDGVAGSPGFIGNAAYRQGEQIVDDPLEYALVNTLGLFDPDTRDRAIANYLDLTAVIPAARVASGPLASGIRSAGQALKPIKQRFIYNAVDPVGYGMGQKIVMAPETFYKNITNPTGRPERIGKLLIPNTADPDNFDIGQLGKNRLDAFAKYLGTKENYGVFQPNYEGQFTFHAPVSPLKFASLYNDILAAKIKNSNAGVYFKDDLVELTRNFNKVMHGDPSTTTYKLNRFLDERGMTKPWEQTRKAGKSNVEGFDDIVFDYDENAVMGGHHYKVTKTPEGYLHFQANDTWDLHPFGKRGNANVIDDDFTKAMQEQHYIKSLRNLEMGKILGGKPFDIKINYLVDPKTFKTIKTWREGGQTHKLQKGGPAYDIPKQPYRNPKIVREEGREWYDPASETIYMKPSYPNVMHEQMVKNHELEHHKQKLKGKLSSTEYWPGPLKEPAIGASDEMIYPYYNRTGEDVRNLMNAVPQSTFFGIPEDIAVMGFQNKTYATPGTAEYEAEHPNVPRTLYRGKPVVKNAIAKTLNREEQDPEMMFRDKYNTELTKEEQKDFDKWVKEESKKQGRDILMDKGAYDIQGFWKSGDFKKMDADNHGTDTWKKPNHPTFSNQSKYNGAGGWYGGNWTEEAGYQPSKQTLERYGFDYYNWLFGEEPNRPEHLDMNRYDGENMGSPIIYKQGGSVKRVKINTLPKNWKTK